MLQNLFETMYRFSRLNIGVEKLYYVFKTHFKNYRVSRRLHASTIVT